MCVAVSALGQYFQFSQYNFTPQRINPALVAGSNDAQLAFVYRNQGTDGGFRLNSSSLNAMYPIQNRQGKRWCGIGVSLLDDRSGQANIFVTREAGISYALNIDIAKDQSLAFGAKMLYQGRRIDLTGLYTGSQYIPDRGFDESLSPGENFGSLKSDYFTFSLGMHWQQEDRDGAVVSFVDVSFFDLNRPKEDFILPYGLNPSLVLSAGFRAFNGPKLSVLPRLLYTRSAANNVVNAGAIFRYGLKDIQRDGQSHLDLMTSYVIGRSAILGMQYQNERFGVGVSYDLPFLNHHVANTGAVEIGLMLKKEIVRNKSKRSKNRRIDVTSRRHNRKAVPANGQKSGQPAKKLAASVGVKKPASVAPVDSLAVTRSDVSTITMSERLKHKQDSIAAYGMAGKVQYDPLELEKATLRFNFGFNSAMPDEEARDYFDQLLEALKDNPALRVKLVGHTDNVGPDKFNLRLSIARAQAIKDYLVEHGLEASRVTVDGRGMREPVNDNSTSEEQALNRRVEMTILYGGN